MSAVAASTIADRGAGYSVTVTEVFRLALTPGSTVLAGHAALGRRIFWARLLGSRPAALGASEAGEMVLLQLAGTPARTFGRLLRDFGEAGVQAVLVSGQPTPGDLAVAEEVGIPVLRLASHTSLVDAERAIISLIVDREAQLRRRVEQINERLLATLVEDAGTAALAAEVAQVTGRPTVVLDEYFRVQVTQPDEERTRELGEAVGAVLAAADPGEGNGRSPAPMRVAAGEGAPDALVVPLRLRGTPAGYLVLGDEGPPSDLDRQIAEQAARVIGIELAKQRAVTEAQLRLQGDFLGDLFSAKYPSEEAMLARARWLGHDLARPHVVLAVAVDEATEDDPHAERGKMRAADLVRTEIVRAVPEALVREQQGALALAVPRPTLPDRTEAVGLAERLRGQLSARLPHSRVTVGVGRSQPGVGGLARAHSEAEQALAIGRVLLGGDRTVHFEELGVQRLLFQLRENPELAAFHGDLLGTLEAHDERQGTELVKTLEAFFECHGNHVRTAQRLHLHRNTLLYRLDRARKVLGVELDDPETRLALQVALKIGRILRPRLLDGAPAPPA